MSKKRRLFSLYILHDVFKRIKEIADKEGRSISEIMNQAFAEFLKKGE